MRTTDKHVPKQYRAEVSRVNKSILDLWKENSESELNANRIVKAMIKLGIPKYTTLRHLKRMISSQILESRDKGGRVLYRLRLKFKEFKHVRYVTELDSAVSDSGTRYEWDEGGAFSHLACGTIVGYPEVLRKVDPDVSFALSILLKNASEIFVALEYLRDVVLLRRAGVHIKFPDEVLRALILQTHLVVLGEEVGDTKSAARKLMPSLSYWKGAVEAICKQNYRISSDVADPNDGIVRMILHDSFEKLLASKSYLRSEGLDISRHTLPQLAEKLRNMERRTDQYSMRELRKQRGSPGMKSVLFPKEMSNQHSLLALAYSTKLAELYSSLGLREKSDMGLIVTRSPGTMDTQTTEEHILYEFIEGAKEYNKEILDLPSEKLARHLGKTFGQLYRNIPAYEIDALKDRPWLQKVLANQVEPFLEAYHSAVNRRIRIEEEIDRKIYATHKTA